MVFQSVIKIKQEKINDTPLTRLPANLFPNNVLPNMKKTSNYFSDVHIHTQTTHSLQKTCKVLYIVYLNTFKRRGVN